MGYLTQISGLITISPPLNAVELRKIVDTWPGTEHDISYGPQIVVEHETTAVPEGQLITPRGVAFTGPSDMFKASGFAHELQGIVNKLGRDDHTYQGYLEGSGEEQGDIWRLYILAPPSNLPEALPRVVVVKPTVTWREPEWGAPQGAHRR